MDWLKIEAGVLVALGMAYAFFGISACGSVSGGMDLECFRERAGISVAICLGGAILGYISNVKDETEKKKGSPLPFKGKQEGLKTNAGKEISI